MADRQRGLWIVMWTERWTSTGKQGITTACPVDSRRILRLPAQTPCATPAQALETHSPPKADTESGGDPETVGEPGDQIPRRASRPVVAGQRPPAPQPAVGQPPRLA